MKITVEKVVLAKEVTKALAFVERKTTIPILANLLITAEDTQVTIRATDLEVSLVASFSAEVLIPGQCTIPARKLSDLLKQLKGIESDVIIETLENNWIQVSCGPLTIKITGMAPENFPNLPMMPTKGVATLKASLLATMIDKVRHAVSSEDSRYMLNAALMVLTTDSLAMVGTDGHRLAHIRKNSSMYPIEARVLIPSGALDRLSKLLASADTVEFAKDENNNLFFRSGGNLVISRSATGNYPNYDAVLPKGYQKLAVLKVKAFSEALTRVSQFADERSRCVRLNVTNNNVTVSAKNSEMGEASEAMDATYTGDALTIGFNANYLLDMLKSMDSDYVQFAFRDYQSAGLFSPLDVDAYQYKTVLMPQRI